MFWIRGRDAALRRGRAESNMVWYQSVSGGAGGHLEWYGTGEGRKGRLLESEVGRSTKHQGDGSRVFDRESPFVYRLANGVLTPPLRGLVYRCLSSSRNQNQSSPHPSCPRYTSTKRRLIKVGINNASTGLGELVCRMILSDHKFNTKTIYQSLQD